MFLCANHRSKTPRADSEQAILEEKALVLRAEGKKYVNVNFSAPATRAKKGGRKSPADNA